MGGKVDYIIAFLFVAFLGAPHLARLMGLEPEQLENRATVERPELAVGKLFDVEFYEELTRYLEDHISLKAQLTRMDALIDFYVFRDSPTSKVLIGRDGWLFLARSLKPSDMQRTRPELVVAALRRLSDTLVSGGIETRFVLSPNKSSLYPEFLSDLGVSLSKEAGRRREHLRDLLAKDEVSRYQIDLWTRFEKEKKQGADLFSPLDRHWNSTAGAIQAEEIVNSFMPELWEKESVIVKTKGIVGRNGELPQRFMNLHIPCDYDIVDVKRLGVHISHRSSVQPVQGSPLRAKVFEALSAEKKLLAGQTVVLHDSFIGHSVRMMAWYCERVLYVNWQELENYEDVFRLISQSERVVVQGVEDFSLFRILSVAHRVRLESLRKHLKRAQEVEKQDLVSPS